MNTEKRERGRPKTPDGFQTVTFGLNKGWIDRLDAIAKSMQPPASKAAIIRMVVEQYIEDQESRSK